MAARPQCWQRARCLDGDSRPKCMWARGSPRAIGPNAQGPPPVPAAGRGPPTWPLSPTSRIAAQNAAGVEETTGSPWSASSGLWTPSVRRPPHEITTAVGAGRVRHRLAAEVDDVALAHARRAAEFENVKRFEREHLIAARRQQFLQPLVHHLGVSGCDRDALRPDLLEAVEDRLAHGADRQAGGRAQLLQQPVVRLRPAIEGQRRADHHDRVDVLLHQVLGRRHDRVERRGVTFRRQRTHADALRDEPLVRIHLMAFGRDLVLGMRDDEADRCVVAHVRLFIAGCGSAVRCERRMAQKPAQCPYSPHCLTRCPWRRPPPPPCPSAPARSS